MKAAEFNRRVKTRRADAEQHLPALTTAYTKILAKLERQILSQFRAQLTASPWQPPPEGNLLNESQIAATAAGSVEAIHRRIVFATSGPILTRLGISWDVTNPFAAQLLEGAGQRTGTAVAEAVRPLLQETILGAYEQGLSVPDTATLLTEKLDHARPISASMLARTDLNGLANGASVMAAQLVGVPYKLWVTAHDERVRETHRAANGQTVPVDQLFQVGGEQAMFPADPGLSDEEACNCRCTVVYTDGVPNALVAAAPPPLDLTPLLDAVRSLEDAVRELELTVRVPSEREVIIMRDDRGEIIRMTVKEI